MAESVSIGNVNEKLGFNVADFLMSLDEKEEKQQQQQQEQKQQQTQKNISDMDTAEFLLSLGEPKVGADKPIVSTVSIDKSSIDDDELGLYGDTTVISSYEELRRNPVIQKAAQRFAIEHLGEKKNIDSNEAIEEMISHFRSFNVNEMTAAGDYNYVSGLVADAESGASYAPKAKRKLEDYKLLFDSFNAMPDFYEDDGAPSAFGDYAEGILTAPSTYVGLLLPGFGKGAGIASTVAAKTATARALGYLAQRPIRTMAGVEAFAGASQDIAAQQTEMEIDRRDNYSVLQTGMVAGISAALPAALTLNAAKKGAGKALYSGQDDILKAGLAAQKRARKEAGIKAQETIKKNKKLATEVKSSLVALNPEKVAAGQAAKKAKVTGPANIDDSFTVTFTAEKADVITAATIDIANASGLKREPTERISSYVSRAFASLPTEKAEKLAGKVMDKYNLTQDDFANMLLADFSEAGRTLRRAADLQDILRASDNSVFAIDREIKEELGKLADKAAKTNPRNALEKTSLADGIVALDRLRLSLMTSQTATTVRNTVSGVVRASLFDLPTKILDRGIATGVNAIAKAAGKPTVAKGFEFGPNNDAFAILAGLGNRKRTNAVMQMLTTNYPRQAGRLFRELADLETNKKMGPLSMGLNKVGREFNTLNTISDNFFKGGAFVGELERALNEMYSAAIKSGRKVNPDEYNLTEIVKKGNLNKLFAGKDGKKLLTDVIDKTLYFTYQRSPQGAAGKLLVNAMNKAPFLTTSLVPFPRFVANALRFTYEYSPAYLFTGARKALSKETGNYEDLAKGLIGLGMYTGAVAFRDSEYAGEQWYEGKTIDGKTYDLRPFFPAAPFLFFADMYIKNRDNKLDTLNKNVILSSVQALTGTQMRAGFGLYAMDNAMLDFANAKEDPDKLYKIAVNFAANIASTYTMPLTMIQDYDNTFIADDDARLARQTKSDDLLSLMVNKTLARVPRNYRIEEMLSDYLGTKPSEVYESPTRAEPIRRETPIRRQTTGMLVKQRKNVLESEMDRLNIRRSDMFKKTAVPEANQLISMFMGEFATDYLVPKVIESDLYKSLDTVGKRKLLMQQIAEYRSDILESVREYSRQFGPDRYGYDPMTRADFRALDSYYRDMAIERYEKAIGRKVDVNNLGDLDLIIKAAKYYKNNTFLQPREEGGN